MVVLLPKTFEIILFSNLLTMRVPDEEFSIKQRVMRTKLDIYLLVKDQTFSN